jgi:hypothetical protein
MPLPTECTNLGHGDHAFWVSSGSRILEADIEVARLKLANALSSVACEDSRDVDVEALKDGALQAMALAYREPLVQEPQIFSVRR